MKISQALNQLANKVGVDSAIATANVVLSPASVHNSPYETQNEAFQKGLDILSLVEQNREQGGCGDVYEIVVKCKTDMFGVLSYRCFYIGTEDQITERLSKKPDNQSSHDKSKIVCSTQ